MYTVNWCKWGEIINETFIPLIENKDRYLILYGSRGSSKSDFAAKKLIYRCLTEDYFRQVLVRNTYNTIEGSQFKNIKDTIHSLGLQELFNFKISPYTITCINGNEFIARGCDEPEKLKSLKDPTGVWWEEDIPKENDFKIITKTIRTTKCEYLQEIFTINPEVIGDYTKHWFYKKFFATHYPVEKTFRDTQDFEIDGKTIQISYTCHHSTVMDNRWASDEYKVMLKSETDSHRYNIDWLGLWSTKITGGNIYKMFKAERHAGFCRYDDKLPLHISVDENKNPYFPMCIFQIDGKKIMLVDLILGINPYNTERGISNEFIRKYPHHNAGLFIYGDATSRNADYQKHEVKGEENYDMFQLLEKYLINYHPKMRVNKSNPSVVMRVNFINSVFEKNEGGLSILINKDLTEAVTDFEQTKEAADGRKAKITIKDKETGVSYQPFGHISDCTDYLVCTAFPIEYNTFQVGKKIPSYHLGTDNYSESPNRY